MYVLLNVSKQTVVACIASIKVFVLGLNFMVLQERDCLQVLEEAIQAAATEADFTFPDDASSSQGDQSLVIDDIIESLESDALEAEQEALAVRQAEEEAQVGNASLYSALILS